MTDTRRLMLRELADALDALPRPLRVGVDGVDGAGKTSLADELAALLAAARVRLDDFTRPREQRYARGELSPDGYYLDSFDLDAFRAAVLAADADVVLCDGVFLQRPELRELLDATIFVACDVETAARRSADRAGLPLERFRARYIPAQRRYLDEQQPHARADFVVENDAPSNPRLERRR